MRTHLLFLLAFCSLLVLFVQAEARYLHARAAVKDEEEDAEEEGEDYDEEMHHNVAAEGEEEDEDKADHSQHREGEGGENEAPREKTFEGPIDEVQTGVDFEKEDKGGQKYGGYEEEDEDYYKIDKRAWDTFCEKLKIYWKNVGNGIRDEWCKLRTMFSNL
ncbi:hypothetical protein HHC11_11050 [Neisseria meningitidis]|nr:hypothetical protein [Neisseria meningitidis]